MRGSWIDSSTVTSTTSRFPGHRGDKIMAAVMHRRPEFAARLACAEGMAPSGARVFKKAYPLAVWAAICSEMRHLGQLHCSP